MISKIELTSSGGAADYHQAAFGGGQSAEADNYYANERVESAWGGEGAKHLGIDGATVTRETFVEALEGRIGGQQLSRQSREYTDKETGLVKVAEGRLGWDFVVSAPKSVSVIGLIGKDERVMAAHDLASHAAISYLEGKAQVRIKESGEVRKETTGNMLYASMKHFTSRENDPQIHTHNVIINATYDKESGTWRSLTNDEIFRERANADKVYHQELSVELKKAGYDVTVDKDGHVEIEGVTQAQREAFSERNKQIAVKLSERGGDIDLASWEARQAASLSTRSEKAELSKAELMPVWAEKAQSVGLDVEQIVAQARVRGPEAAYSFHLDARRNAESAVAGAVRHLSLREAAFSYGAVTSAAADFAKGTTSRGHIKAAVDKAIKSGQLPDAPKGLLTTPAAKIAVSSMVKLIASGKKHGVVISDDKVFFAALGKFETAKELSLVQQGKNRVGEPFKLSAEQIGAAKSLLMGKEGVQGIQGGAGTGKTAALEFVKHAADAAGWEVRGYAPTSAAAAQLEKDSGIQSKTLQGALLGGSISKVTEAERREIGALKAQIATIDRQMSGKAGSDRAMALTTLGVSFKDHYTFSANGDVYKIDRGFLSLGNMVSKFSQDRTATFLANDRRSSSIDMSIGMLASQSRYTFLKDGAILKAANGSLNPGNAAAVRATDRGNADMRRGKSEWANATTVMGKIEAVGIMIGAKIDQTMGKALTKQTRVTGMESIKANLRASRSVSEAHGVFDKIAAAGKVVLMTTENKIGQSGLKHKKVTGWKKTWAVNENKLALQAEKNTLKDAIKDIESGKRGSKVLHVLDEAGLASQKDISKFVDLVAARGGKSVLQGDIKQHGSVGAGTAFQTAQDAGMKTSVISVVMRQTKENVVGRAAVAEMTRDGGSMSAAVNMLDFHELKVRDGQAPESQKEDLYKLVAERYMANKAILEAKYPDQPDRQTVGVISPRNADREGVNEAIRDSLKVDGRISAVDHTKEVYTKSGISEEEARTASNYAVGQKVVPTKDAGDLKAGEAVTITAIDSSKNLIVGETKTGDKVTIDPDKNRDIGAFDAKERNFSKGDQVVTTAILKEGANKLLSNNERLTIKSFTHDGVKALTSSGQEIKLTNEQMRHVDHGYAQTSVKSQGATNQSQIVLATVDSGRAINEQMAYVGTTRAREHTEIVTDNREKVVSSMSNANEKSVAVDVVVPGAKVTPAVDAPAPTVAAAVDAKAAPAVEGPTPAAATAVDAKVAPLVEAPATAAATAVDTKATPAVEAPAPAEGTAVGAKTAPVVDAPAPAAATAVDAKAATAVDATAIPSFNARVQAALADKPALAMDAQSPRSVADKTTTAAVGTQDVGTSQKPSNPSLNPNNNPSNKKSQEERIEKKEDPAKAKSVAGIRAAVNSGPTNPNLSTAKSKSVGNLVSKDQGREMSL